MVNDNFDSNNDLNAQYTNLSDSDLVACYVTKLNNIFQNSNVKTNSDYDFCIKTFDFLFKYTNESMIDSVFDSEVKCISGVIISDLNQYIEQDLGIKVTKDELIKMNDLLFPDNINKAISINSPEVSLYNKIYDMHHKSILYGNKYYLIKEFNIAINIIDCRLINRIIGNDGIDIVHYLYFKYSFSFDNDLKNKVLCLINK